MKKDTLLELIGMALENKTENKTDLPFEVGEKYFIRTVTNYTVGRLKEIKGGFLVFEKASWIADTGRFADFLANGKPKEVEPIKGFCRVAIASIVDAFDWNHDLPSEQI